MKAIKATVKNGSFVLEEPTKEAGEFEAVLVLLDADPWDATAKDPRPRPELAEARKEALAEFHNGKTPPVDPDKAIR